MKMWILLASLLLLCRAIDSKDYTVVVKTGDDWNAGTDAQVKIRVHGTLGNIREREIKGVFEKGSIDTVPIQDYDIGLVTGMEIYRNNDGIFPNWKLDKVIIKIDGAPDSIFNYNDWADAGWTSLPLSCSEGIQVNQQGYCAPDYTVVVKTGDDWNAGTDAQVKIRVHGTLGNIREREIKGVFEKGSTDTIHIQDYDIGRVTGMEIYRNDDGAFPNWKLDYVIIKSDEAPDSIFKYNGWIKVKLWTSLPLSCPEGHYVNQQHYCERDL